MFYSVFKWKSFLFFHSLIFRVCFLATSTPFLTNCVCSSLPLQGACNPVSYCLNVNALAVSVQMMSVPCTESDICRYDTNSYSEPMSLLTYSYAEISFDFLSSNEASFFFKLEIWHQYPRFCRYKVLSNRNQLVSCYGRSVCLKNSYWGAILYLIFYLSNWTHRVIMSLLSCLLSLFNLLNCAAVLANRLENVTIQESITAT